MTLIIINLIIIKLYYKNMGKIATSKPSGLNSKNLLKIGVPAVLIPGLLIAGVLGWKGEELQNVKNYYQIKTIFPDSGVVGQVEDGDTFILKSGVRVRLLGIDAPNRGEVGFDEGKKGLNGLIGDKRVYLEYDRYQDDKYGRVLSWIWIGCESTPKFKPPDYMHLTDNTSRPGLLENPEGCKQGKLVNEEMVKAGLAPYEKYKDRGELKYELRIKNYEV
jgi:endonuclease YncB( thermonuclease family)